MRGITEERLIEILVIKEYFDQYIASKPGFPASAKIGHRKWNPGNYISSYTNANTAWEWSRE